MTDVVHFSLLVILLLLLVSIISTHGAEKHTAPPKHDLVRTSCVHASYPNICLRTLSSYSGPANTPRDLAQAAVKVSLSRARTASDFVSQLRSHSKREEGALNDCVEQMGDSMEELSKTLEELHHLRSGDFRWQMSNAETWVSAALTNEDTCKGIYQISCEVQ